MANEGKDPAAAVSDADESKPVHVMELLKQFDFLSIGLKGKIHCALTKRDLPLNTVAIQQHLNSKKLKKEREWYNADFSKYEPLIVAHKTNPKLLFCTLTHKELNRIPKQVEAHVNGKRFKNRKAEMEGLKQAERQPMKEESEEEGAGGGGGEEEEEDDDDFWMPPGGAEVEDMEEESVESNPEDEDEDEDEDEEEEAEDRKGAAAGGRVTRRSKSRGATNKAGAQARKSSEGSGRGDKAKAKANKATKGRRKDDGDDDEDDDGEGAQENGVSAANDGESDKQGGAKHKQKQRAGGEEAGKAAAKSGKSGPLSDDTPAVANTVKKEAAAAPTALPSPRAKAKKVKNPKKTKGAETPEGKRVVGGESPVAARSATKRKHQVSEELTSSGRKKRKA
eukprot:g11755.t1